MYESLFQGFAGLASFTLVVLVFAGYWKVFEKAGHSGWKAIIPIYNVVILLRIIEKPWWWILLLIIPPVGLVFGIIMVHLLSKAFGRGGWYTVGIILLPFIFIPMLGFGDASFQKALPMVRPSDAQTKREM